MRLLLSTLCLALLCLMPARADDLLVKPSKHSVAVTMDRLVAALKEKGIAPAARIDHAAAAKANGLELKPTEVVLFGNPKLGTPLMQANRHIAIDLPLRAMAWEDEQGKVWIAYTKPETLQARYGLKQQDAAFTAMAGALDAFTKAAAE